MRPAVQTRLHWLAANVRRLRTSRGWTQEQLAERAEVDVRYIRTIESPRSNPRAAVLLKLAIALDVSLGPLFDKANLLPRRRGRPPGKARRGR